MPHPHPHAQLASLHAYLWVCVHASVLPQACMAGCLQGGEDVTRLSKIVLYGSAGEIFNVAEIKKQEG